MNVTLAAFAVALTVLSQSTAHFYFVYRPGSVKNAILRSYRAEIVKEYSPEWVLVKSDVELHGRGIYRVRKLKPLLYTAEKSIGLNPGISGLPPGCTGVVIGIVDTGIDLYHPDFIYPDGTNVFSYIWDQTREGAPPDGFDYGYECDTVDINSFNCPVFDDNTGHGTHISGILASLNPEYPGLCTDAVIVVVKSRYDEVSVIDAVCYIRNIASKYGYPFVVNLSLGAQYGPHDGTTPFEQLISECAGENGIVVAAAGNDGDFNVHCGGNGPGGCTAIAFPILFSSAGGLLAEMWADPVTGVNFVVGALSDRAAVIEKYLEPGTFYSFYFNDYGIGITIDAADSPSPLNGDYHVEFRIYGPRFTTYHYFIGVTSENMEFRWDMWLTEGNAAWATETGRVALISDTFVSFPGTPTMTINIPATSPDIIAVGSYVSRTTWIDSTGALRSIPRPEGVLSSFSSLGPARKNLYLKPDITAPGEVVISTKSGNASISSAYVAQDSTHMVMWGTSVAAPFVSGLIARAMEGCRSINPLEIRSSIYAHALSDSFTGLTPNWNWGWGKLYWSEDLIRGVRNSCFDIIPEIESLDSDKNGNIRWKLSHPARVEVDVYDGDTLYVFTSSTVSDTGYVFVPLKSGIYRYFIILPDYRVVYGYFTLILSTPSPSCAFVSFSSSSLTMVIVILAVVLTFLPLKWFWSKI